MFCVDAGTGTDTFLLIHGTGGDHTHFNHQIEYFSRHARVIAPDLRGHGRSPKPEEEYTLELYAEDLHELIAKCEVERPILVGFSMGGNVAIELAHRYPDLAKAIVVLDSALPFNDEMRQAVQEYIDQIEGPDFPAAISRIMDEALLPTDRFRRSIEATFLATPPYVLASSFRDMIRWDGAGRLRALKTPLLYIQASKPIIDISELRTLCPHLVDGKVVGSGHMVQIETPDQVNSMIEQFVSHLNRCGSESC
jgi:pimeloyl-ACP methyl ester carboxylesterase